MEFSIVDGVRFRSKLLYAEEYLYKKRRVELGGRRTRWHCHTSSCPAKVVVTDGVCSRPSTNHNHPSQMEEMALYRLKNRIQSRCVNENSSSRTIYNEEVSR